MYGSMKKTKAKVKPMAKKKKKVTKKKKKTEYGY
tara:strand:+ start:666 stop:767 length:102 start_codon:yes stop_codon:yes gene_type:complete